MQTRFRRNNTIDILRLILSIAVVSIHTMAFYSLGEGAWVATSLGVARIAVPFFFIVTGYFFYNKVNDSVKSNKYIMKTFKFYITWVIIEVIFLIPMIVNIFSQDVVGGIIRVLMVGVTGSLWYISSMILALIVVKPLLKRNRFFLLSLISIILFGIGLCGDSYYYLAQGSIIGSVSEWYTSIFGMANIGFTFSVPFVVLGAAINRFNLKDKIKGAGLISILGIALLLFEAFMLYYNGIAKDYNMYLSLIVVVPAIFIWALNSKLSISDRVGSICREYSIGIYCTHQALMMYCFMFINPLMQFTVLRFVITLVVASILTFVLTKIKITKKYLLLSE